MSDILPGYDRPHRPSFTVKNRLRRAGWNVVYALLFRPSPIPLHGWRSFLLRLHGAKIAKAVRVYPKVVIWAPWNIDIDEYVGIANDVTLYSMGVIKVGAHVTVSQGSYLCAGTHDYEDPNFQLVALPIVIGERAWVCAQAFVGPGVTIGDGAVVGARSVVTKDMPAWTVCAGNPCRPLKPRVVREGAP